MNGAPPTSLRAGDYVMNFPVERPGDRATARQAMKRNGCRSHPLRDSRASQVDGSDGKPAMRRSSRTGMYRQRRGGSTADGYARAPRSAGGQMRHLADVHRSRASGVTPMTVVLSSFARTSEGRRARLRCRSAEGRRRQHQRGGQAHGPSPHPAAPHRRAPRAAAAAQAPFERGAGSVWQRRVALAGGRMSIFASYSRPRST
jgi:hypothetical protein